VTPVEARLDTHEQVCEFRYDSINARLKRIEQILIGSMSAINTHRRIAATMSSPTDLSAGATATGRGGIG